MQFEEKAKLFIRFLKENDSYLFFRRYFSKYKGDRTLNYYLNITDPKKYITNMYFLRFEGGYYYWEKMDARWKQVLLYDKLKRKHLQFLFPLSKINANYVLLIIQLIAMSIAIARALNFDINNFFNLIIFSIIGFIALWSFMFLIHVIVVINCVNSKKIFITAWNDVKDEFKNLLNKYE